MDTDRFAKGTERLVDPVTVGSIHFLQQFVGLVPRGCLLYTSRCV